VHVNSGIQMKELKLSDGDAMQCIEVQMRRGKDVEHMKEHVEMTVNNWEDSFEPEDGWLEAKRLEEGGFIM